MNTKKMKKSISRVALLPATVLLSLVTAVGAHAADLSVAPLYKAPPAPVAPPPYNWSGFYLGANGGGGWSASHWDSVGGTNGSGGVVGGTAGLNWQTGHAVFGIEGDIDWSNIKGTTTTACPAGCTTQNDWLATVRGRAGYAFDRVLPYVVTSRLRRRALRARPRPMRAGPRVADSNSRSPTIGPPRPNICMSTSAT